MVSELRPEVSLQEGRPFFVTASRKHVWTMRPCASASAFLESSGSFYLGAFFDTIGIRLGGIATLAERLSFVLTPPSSPSANARCSCSTRFVLISGMS